MPSQEVGQRINSGMIKELEIKGVTLFGPVAWLEGGESGRGAFRYWG